MEVFNVILLAGKAGSGKDTVAYRLVESHAFAQVAFADFLKELAVIILHGMDCTVSSEYFEKRELKETFIRDIHDRLFEFRTEKRNGVSMTYRQFMQQLGTEALRDVIHKDMWVIPVQKFIRDAYTDSKRRFRGVVISDTRFPNEIDGIKEYCREYGDRIAVTDVNIIRPDASKMDRHASETSLKNHEFSIGLLNNGTMEELFIKVDKLATGEWKLDRINAKIQETHQNSWLRKYDNKQ